MSTSSTSKHDRKSQRAPVPVGSKKRQRTSTSGSPTGSSLATNENGLTQLDGRLRSVLSHRLGLPLVYAFNGRDPGKLNYLRQKSDYFSSAKENDFNEVFKDAFDKWRENKTGQENEEEQEIEEKQEKETLQQKKNPRETALTKNLTATINDKKWAIPLEAKGEVPLGGARVDIGLYQKNTGRPLMFVEVGLSGVEWWKKFDQGIRYVKKTQEDTQQRPTDTSPLLLAIMTVDDGRQSKKPNPRFEVKLGLFLPPTTYHHTTHLLRRLITSYNEYTYGSGRVLLQLFGFLRRTKHATTHDRHFKYCYFEFQVEDKHTTSL